MGGVVQGRLTPTWPTKFYIDASLPVQIRKTFKLLRDDVVTPDDPDCSITPEDLDETWLPIVGAADWLVIMRDKRVRYRPRQKQLLIRHQVRAFCLSGGGNYTRWQLIDLLVRRWPQIEQKGQTEAGPYVYSVTQDPLIRKVY